MKDQKAKGNKRFYFLYRMFLFLGILFVLCGCGTQTDGGQYTVLDEKYLTSEDFADEIQEKEEIQESEQEPEKEPSIKAEDEDQKKKPDEQKADKQESEKPVQRKKKETSGQKTSEAPKSEKAEDSARKKEQKTQKKEEKKKSDPSAAKQTKKPVQNTPVPKKEVKEPEKKETTEYCTISIECTKILEHMEDLKEKKISFVPKDGWILEKKKVKIEDHDSVYDILYRVCRENEIHIEAKYTPAYDTYYVEGIHQLYEFDCGNLSGWMYFVNGEKPNYGCSNYKVSEGDEIVWSYTCDAGRDI